jgi:serine/threonine protein kinase
MAHEQDIVGAAIAGKYRIRRVIGGGSMGVVCEAEHLEIGKRVAIKLIDASLAGMTDVAMRFRQEARATSLVESHHIVQVFDVGTDERLGLYLVMEYLTGEDLAKRLLRDRRLPLEAAVRIAVQVARGLAKAHDAGVVHRDLKPANIFLCTSEDDHALVKILDFGISKVLASSLPGSSPGLKLTRDGMVVGTPQYMSPEQAQGYTVDLRSDVWALGLVLYEMLAGRPAYPELPTYEQFIIHLVSKPPDPLDAVAPWVPQRLARVVHAAIEHDLSRRIQTCGELVRRLMEAYPIHPSRIPEPTAIETTDTWSDPSAGSFDDDGSGRSPGALRRRVAPPRGPVPTSPQLGAPLASSSGVRIASEPPPPPSPSSSRVRGTSPDAPRAVAQDPDDFRDDAPQFFDRKLLRAWAPPPADERDVRGEQGVGAVGPAPGDSRASDPDSTQGVALASPAPPRRWGLRWAGVALVLLGLAAVASLAFR